MPAALRPRPLGPYILTLYLAWASIAVAEVALARVSAGAPSLAGTAAELGILLGAATVHAFTLGRLPLLSGPFTPGALMLLATALHTLMGRGLVQRTYPLSPGDLVLLILGAGLVGEAIERRSPRAAALLAVAVAPAWALLHSLELGYYLGGRSTAVNAALAAAPAAGIALAAVAAVAILLRPAAPAAAAAAALVLSMPLRAAPPPRDALRDPRPDLILITVDTLRADEAARMATFQRLAARGVRFTDALAPSGWTLPSMGSIVTGVYPADHGAYRLGDKWPSHGQLRADRRVLAEMLHQAGYNTALLCANPNLDPGFGFRRGMDHYVNLFRDAPTRYFGLGNAGRGPALAPDWPSPHDGGLIVDEALRYLDQRPDRPTFLWVHTLDNHLPYYHAKVPEASVLRPTFGPTIGKQLTVQLLRMGRLWANPPVLDALRDAYRQEVSYTDAQLTRLLDGLEARGMLDGAVVALTSDHGEEFFEHGSFEHGHTLYEELVRVPLVLSWPGGPAGVERGDPVDLVDLLPTFLDAAQAPRPEALAGQSLRDAAPADRARLLHGNLYGRFMEGVVVGPHKLLRLDREETWRLYDRGAGEAADLSAAQPEVVSALRAHLGAADPGGRGDEARLNLDGLKALGYIDP